MSATLSGLFFLFAINIAHSNCLIELKREESARSLQANSRFQQNIKTLFSEQKDGPYLAIGTLVELSSGERVLTFTDYLGVGHDSALLDLQERSKPKTIKRILWAGELEAVSESNGIFSILRANETSGRIFNHISGKEMLPLDFRPDVENKVANLEKYLRDSGLGKNFRSESYNPSQPHLFDIGFELKAGETLGHLFENKINQVAAVASIIESEAAGAKALLADDVTEAAEMAAYTLPIVRHMQKMYHQRASQFFGTGLTTTIRFLESVEKAQKDFIAKGLPIPSDLQKTIQDNSKGVGTAIQRVGPAAKSLQRISTQMHVKVPSHFLHLSLP